MLAQAAMRAAVAAVAAASLGEEYAQLHAELTAAAASFDFVASCPAKCQCFSAAETLPDVGWTYVRPPRDLSRWHDGELWSPRGLLHLYPRCSYVVECSGAALSELPVVPLVERFDIEPFPDSLAK